MSNAEILQRIERLEQVVVSNSNWIANMKRKYMLFRDNIQWHLDKKPQTPEDRLRLEQRLRDYDQVIRDLNCITL